jgi:NADPH2:quinone reductase
VKAIQLHQYGGPEVLVYADLPDPKPGPGEVLIKVLAAGVNWADTMRRRNELYPEPTPLPFILGVEIAGVVEALGEGVTSPPVGTSVFAVPGAGGYAQYICVPAEIAIPIPPQLDAVRAAAIAVQGLTALLVLQDVGRLQAGENVLVQAAAGGVGAIAVQLAKHLGAGRVIALASTAEKLAFTRTLGADVAIDYTQSQWFEKVREATDGKGVDLVLEMTGGDVFEQSMKSLAPFGRIVVYGNASGESVAVDPMRLVGPNQAIAGFYLGGHFSRPNRLQAALNEIVASVSDGRLKLHIGTRLPLDRAAEAHRLLEERKTVGKVILEPWLNL